MVHVWFHDLYHFDGSGRSIVNLSMHLLPINQNLENNEEFMHDPSNALSVQATVDFYKSVGFVIPWIGYFVEKDGLLVGSAGF